MKYKDRQPVQVTGCLWLLFDVIYIFRIRTPQPGLWLCCQTGNQRIGVPHLPQVRYFIHRLIIIEGDSNNILRNVRNDSPMIYCQISEDLNLRNIFSSEWSALFVKPAIHLHLLLSLKKHGALHSALPHVFVIFS